MLYSMVILPMQVVLQKRLKMPCLQAVQLLLTLQAIARHSGGASRMNVGVFESGTGRNVTPDVATLKLETRGATQNQRPT